MSHHGSHEFGSPSLPQIPEAVALNFIDDIDSKMAGMRKTPRAGSAELRLQTSLDRSQSLAARARASQGKIFGGWRAAEMTPSA